MCVPAVRHQRPPGQMPSPGPPQAVPAACAAPGIRVCRSAQAALAGDACRCRTPSATVRSAAIVAGPPRAVPAACEAPGIRSAEARKLSCAGNERPCRECRSAQTIHSQPPLTISARPVRYPSPKARRPSARPNGYLSAFADIFVYYTSCRAKKQRLCAIVNARPGRARRARSAAPAARRSRSSGLWRAAAPRCARARAPCPRPGRAPAR